MKREQLANTVRTVQLRCTNLNKHGIHILEAQGSLSCLSIKLLIFLCKRDMQVAVFELV